MGFWEDALLDAEQWFDEEYDRQAIRISHMENGVWITKDGQEIKIMDMTDSHLLNAYRMIMRSGDEHTCYIYRSALEAELSRRGIEH